MFSALGIPVWDADEAAKSLYRTDASLRNALIERWGDDVAARNELGHVVDVVRAEVAKRVFQNPEEMAWLESLVHPAVGVAFETWIGSLGPTATPSMVIREAAILFESGSHSTCDAVVTVEAPESVRIERAKTRAAKRGEAVPTEEEIRARMNRQWTREQRVKSADIVLENAEGNALLPQILAALQSLEQMKG